MAKAHSECSMSSALCLLQKIQSLFYTCDNIVVTGAKLQYYYTLGGSRRKHFHLYRHSLLSSYKIKEKLGAHVLVNSALFSRMAAMSFRTSQPHWRSLWRRTLHANTRRSSRSRLVRLDQHSGRCLFSATGWVTFCWGDDRCWRMSVNWITCCCFSHVQVSSRGTLQWPSANANCSQCHLTAAEFSLVLFYSNNRIILKMFDWL